VRQHEEHDSGGREWNPPNERRRKADKMSMRIGKETASGKSQETFQNAGDVKNGTAGL
jgi:hypothetical protein